MNIPTQETGNASASTIHQGRKAHFQAWLNQFKPSDRRLALMFLEKLRCIDHPRLLGHLKNSHQKLMEALSRDGFVDKQGAEDVFSKVDFTTLFKASSGDVVTYFYRKANGIPKIKFHDQAALAHNGHDKSNRTLVIVDDYLATGAQFFGEALGHGDNLHHDQNKHLANLVKDYKKVYFVVAGVHEKALQRFEKIEAGKLDDAIADILEGYQELGNERYQNPVKEKLGTLKKDKLQLIYSFVEHPLLSTNNPKVTPDERTTLQRFLSAYNVYKYPYGVGNLQGNTVFYYSAPNNLPDMLWNTKSFRLNPDGTQDKSRRWLPLFHRLEDISAYWVVKDKNIPPKGQTW